MGKLRWWVYNRLVKSQLKNNVIEVYPTHSEEKWIVAEILTRIMKNKIFKYMTAISKNVYINKILEIVKNNTTNTSNIWNLVMLILVNILIFLLNLIKKTKFKVVHHVRIWKCKNIFSKDYIVNWTKKYL